MQLTDNTYFIGDLHFGHKEIIQYANRPFQTVHEMDEYLIDKWNKRLSPHSDIVVAGDFSAYGVDRTSEIIKSLKGHKLLILGNHDVPTDKTCKTRTQYYLDCGFDEVSLYPIIMNEFIMVSHEPLYMNQTMPYLNIFAHVHSNPSFCDFSANSFCVSAERIGYEPITFGEIMQKCKQD